jgi:dethiobiotin synthetase
VTGHLVIVTGTGTGIGKTHFAEALLRALQAHGTKVAGIKPIESGVEDPSATDAARLARASTFHVKRFGYAFEEGVSPHLAARRSGETIDTAKLRDEIAAACRQVDLLLVELPGGLFSPVTATELNADLAAACRPDTLLAVVSDRLGALHDAMACGRAAGSSGLRIDTTVFMAPPVADPSTGTNSEEFRILSPTSRAFSLPRIDPTSMAARDPVVQLAARLAAPARQSP